MSGPTITITVDPKGGVTVATRGFAGTACLVATRTLERALGRVLGDQPTPELHLPGTATDPTRLRTDS